MNFNFTQEFCSFVNYFQMKREIFLQRVRKGLRQHLNFKGELFARKTEGEREEITSGGARGWREPPLPLALPGRAEGTGALRETLTPWHCMYRSLCPLTSLCPSACDRS